jgi:hypothetical protein
MGVRFRKRIKLAPGLHLNLSGSGLSVFAGPRGASMTFGGRGSELSDHVDRSAWEKKQSCSSISSVMRSSVVVISAGATL